MGKIDNAEIARAFVKSGATVCICNLDEGALAAAAKEIPSLITKVCTARE